MQMTSMTTTVNGGFRISRRGRRPRGGAYTPEAVTFRKFCMSKRKNLDPWGRGRAPDTPHKSANECVDRLSCKAYLKTELI